MYNINIEILRRRCMSVYEGFLTVTNEKFCIIVSRFNEFISSKLLSGALDELKRHGVKEEDIDIVWCPGAFEIPVVAKKCAKKLCKIWQKSKVVLSLQPQNRAGVA